MIETRVTLIERVRDQADQAAWSEFFAAYQPLLTAYVRKQGISAHDAADVVQDVFARLVPAMAGFEYDQQRGRFRSWLWRVTHNALADWARRRAIRNRAEQEWGDRFESLANGNSNSDWDQLYRSRIIDVVLERIKASTQPATWSCFERRILAGRPAAEIAEELKITTNSVYVNASRVLARIREECAAFEEPLV